MTEYILHKPSRSILLKPELAPLVLPVVEKARLARLGEKTVLQVFHGESETKVLSELLGVQVDSPILHYYNFPKVRGKFKPFEHQPLAAAFATIHQRCHLLLPMGTGKSYTATAAASYLIDSGQIKKVLILCPMSCMTPVWSEEIWSGFYENKSSIILHGTAQQRIDRLEEQVDFYIGNHALIQVAVAAKTVKDRTVYELRPAFKRLLEMDLIIFDESSMLRNAQTHLWHGLKALLQEHTRLWLLSGFPCPSGPEGAWSQSKLVAPDKTPKYFGEWRRQVCYEEKKGPFSKWLPRQGSEQLVFNLLQPAYHVDKSKVLDLPPLTIERREVELSKEQKDAYRKMHNQMVMEFEESGGKINAVSAGDKVLKLRQILIGSVKSGEGEYADFSDVPRVKTVLEIIEQSDTKVIVISPFTGALRAVADAIKKKKYSVAIIEGNVGIRERDEIVRSFQETKDPHVLVCQPRTMSHGITLTAAATMICIGPVSGNDTWQQTIGRMDRQGQTHHMTVFQLYANALETRLYDALDNAQNFQESVMELYRQEMESKQ